METEHIQHRSIVFRSKTGLERRHKYNPSAEERVSAALPWTVLH